MGLFDRRDDLDRAQALPASAPRSLTASAARVRLDDKDEIDRFKKRKQADSWQTDAWEYFDAIGEIKYSGSLIGAVLSRIRLYPAYNVDPDQPPSHIADAAKLDRMHLPETMVNDCDRVLQRLQSANGGVAGILNRAGVNLWVAGECYLVQTPAKLGSNVPERWDIKSVDELIVSGSGKLSLKTSRTARPTAADELPDGAFAGRIWRSHPRYSEESDSSLRAVRDLADELLLLGRTAKATARSRLNAGALYLPDGLSVSADADEDLELDPVTGEVLAVLDEEDAFEQELVDAMTTPIADEESASAVVPLIIRGPAELGAAIKQFKFERSFDPALEKRAAQVLERLMHGLDIPKNVVSGLENVRYTNAVQIDETLYKAHVEPLVLMICDALTEVYFRPALKALGYDAYYCSRALVWYDPSEILTRPDRAQSANEGFDRKAISAEAWRKAHGYAEADAPTTDELVKRAVLERGPVAPDIAAAIFRVLAPVLLTAAHNDSIANNPAGPFSPNAENILDGGNGLPSNNTPPNPSSAVPTSAPGPGTQATTPTPESPQPARATATGVQQ